MEFAEKIQLDSVALTNFAASGSIGTALTTIDLTSYITINQTTANISLTLPTPTITTGGSLLYISNIGTVPVTVGGELIKNGTTAFFMYNATAWALTGTSKNNTVSTTLINYAALTTDSTIVLTNTISQTVTLTAVASSIGNIVTIVNPTAASKIVSSFTNLLGVVVSTIAANTSITLQSDGTIWRQIATSTISSGFPTTLTTTTTTGTITATNTTYMQLTAVPAGTYDVMYKMTLGNNDTNNREWATGITINNAAQAFPTGADGVSTILGALSVNHPFTVVGYNRVVLAATGTIEVKGQIYGTQVTAPVFAGTNRLTATRVA
jgi:hypothetical protein